MYVGISMVASTRLGASTPWSRVNSAVVLLAEGDFVTGVVTRHMKHVGEWEGIAPTGRSVAIADLAVVRMQDGKIAEEWVVADRAGLKQQLAATE